jgi:hypothetical protein
MRRCASQARVLCARGALGARAFHLPNVSLDDAGVTGLFAIASFRGFRRLPAMRVTGAAHRLCSGATPRRTTGAHSRLTLFRMRHWETLRATGAMHPIVTVAVVTRRRQRGILLWRGRAGRRIAGARRGQQQNTRT